jgi:hypothetical protein
MKTACVRSVVGSLTDLSLEFELSDGELCVVAFHGVIQQSDQVQWVMLAQLSHDKSD